MSRLERSRVVVAVAGRLVLGALFAWAAVGKLADPSSFARSIANYRIVSAEMTAAFASIIPVVELVITLALLAGVWTRGAATGAALLLAGFTVAMAQAMARGINLDCGCFGAAGAAVVGWPTIVRNVVLLGLGVLIATAPSLGLGWQFARRAPKEPLTSA